MKTIKCHLDGILLIEPIVYQDERGFFLEGFQKERYAKVGITEEFVQDNHSRSEKNVLRGLHFTRRKPQSQIVTVIRGKIFDVVVDIRPDSPTRGQWVGERLSADNKRQMWVPPGLAHGFLVLSEHAEFLYKTTDYWYPEHERSLLWSDPELAIDWPSLPMAPLLAAKDASAPTWAQTQASLG